MYEFRATPSVHNLLIHTITNSLVIDTIEPWTSPFFHHLCDSPSKGLSSWGVCETHGPKHMRPSSRMQCVWLSNGSKSRRACWIVFTMTGRRPVT